MRKDIETTLEHNRVLPDSILILSTSSPDGVLELNRRLAKRRAANTEKLLHTLFPQFKYSNFSVKYLEEDWEGLRQVLRGNPEFPQREEMLAVIESQLSNDEKEAALRKYSEGWECLINDYIYVLRNSSVTITVVGKPDEYTISDELSIPDPITYTPVFTAPASPLQFKQEVKEPQWRKTIFAARTNLLIPGMNVGVEIPIGNHWSIGLDYYYPWAVSKGNKWCVEMLGWFADVKYWFPGSNNLWVPDSRLKGHAVGVYGGLGYYDFQNKAKGAQGEFVNVGVDYTYALPIANDKLRLEFNVGLGYIYTLYRPYYPASDFSDLIKEPGIKHRSTNFFGPTKAGVSLVIPITVPVKKNPYKVKGGDR